MTDGMGFLARRAALSTVLIAAFISLTSGPVRGQDAATPDAAATAPAETVEETVVVYEVPDDEMMSFSFDNIILVLCAVLVIFMQAGFTLVEVGLNSAKNAVNILSKNAIDFCIGVVLYFLVGYSLMYPGADYAGKYFGFVTADFSGQRTTEDIHAGFATGALRSLHPQADFLFQAAFCATAATIVSGAVAGRMKFSAYLVYTVMLTGLVYPIVGFWKWGGGWLATAGFHDFAGSLVVHACGGFAGLAGAIVLGPRLGRYTSDGRSVPIPGHNLAYATLGVFILLIGWYGFNPGSQLGFAGYNNTAAFSLIAVNTTLAACTGGLSGMLLSWIMFKKPDLTMLLNGILAGLVGITANCDAVTNHEALIIGAVAGVLVLLAIVALDKMRIDDPVGAFPVHGVCGIWGGLAAWIFGGKPMMAQVMGCVAIPVFAFVTMFVLFMILKMMGMLRVSKEEEIEGLDIHEHGMPCYGADVA